MQDDAKTLELIRQLQTQMDDAEHIQIVDGSYLLHPNKNSIVAQVNVSCVLPSTQIECLQWFDANWVNDSDKAADDREKDLIVELLQKRQKQRSEDYEEMLLHEEELEYNEDFYVEDFLQTQIDL